ncbi:hypothetical protein [Streptomyces roseolus]|uniref:hypothetical protein n=1 Tax=Streptomyces roseolus TaxID=67358 RepID=UPI0016722D7F|nr:hypothetical protein [Streptomyces roseolus]GGR42745.1 hypothetical protein GCM10010282_39700 [Streptomyces roseolus]
MSRLGPAHLRMAGLGTVVAIAVLVPPAATAGRPDEAPPSTSRAPAHHAPDGRAPAGDAKPGGVAGELLGELGLGGEERTGESARPVAPKEAPPSASAAAEAAGTPERVSRCGPEVASPEGVEAQTCVLSEGPDVWARTYYRNATGREIDAILTLMAPGGRTVQVRCPVPARDEPGTCETPREPGTGAARAHTAVAEFAGKEEGGGAPLLLRSGSNTAEDEAS